MRVRRQLWVQARYRRPQVAREHDLADVGAAERAVGSESFAGPSGYGFPAQRVVQVVGEGFWTRLSSLFWLGGGISCPPTLIAARAASTPWQHS